MFHVKPKLYNWRSETISHTWLNEIMINDVKRVSSLQLSVFTCIQWPVTPRTLVVMSHGLWVDVTWLSLCCWSQVCWYLARPLFWTSWGSRPRRPAAAARTPAGRVPGEDTAPRNMTVVTRRFYPTSCSCCGYSASTWQPGTTTYCSLNFRKMTPTLGQTKHILLKEKVDNYE